MKTYAPDYYPQFQCIADRCKHSCCVGWEIDIDADTYQKYQDMPGEIGQRLRENIAAIDGVASFIPGPGDRCPFLNQNGLCDLITACGEEILCEICDKHPRFYHWYADRTEVGLGLSCEAAAAEIVERKNPMELICVDSDEQPEEFDAEEQQMLSMRTELLAIVTDRSRPIGKRIESLLAYCKADLPEKSIAEWAEIYRGLERLDAEWDTVLDALECLKDRHFDAFYTEIPSEQLLGYFIYRHIPDAYFDDRFTAGVLFAVLSTGMIGVAASVLSTEQPMVEAARLYSGEVEYSEENLDAMLQMLEMQAVWREDVEALV